MDYTIFLIQNKTISLLYYIILKREVFIKFFIQFSPRTVNEFVYIAFAENSFFEFVKFIAFFIYNGSFFIVFEISIQLNGFNLAPVLGLIFRVSIVGSMNLIPYLSSKRPIPQYFNRFSQTLLTNSLIF